MLSINKINININNTFASNPKSSSFGNITDAKNQAYFDMNKDVYLDYVDGDISFVRLLLNRCERLCKRVFAQDPTLETKSRILEKKLLHKSKQELSMPEVDKNEFDMVA